MRFLQYGVALAVVASFQTAAPAQGQEGSVGDRILNALREGERGVAFRYRYEFVTDDAVSLDGHASTLRTLLDYRTVELFGLSAYLQVEDVSSVGAASMHRNRGAGDLDNGVTDRPVIADPPVTALNQVYARYARSGVTATFGRQEILLDNHRFVGNVGWRQHHQTYDALRVSGRWDRLSVHYAFIDAVRRIFGDKQKTSHHILNASVEIPELGTVTAYAYLLDYDEVATVGQSTNTFGAELAGTRSLTPQWTVRYEGEYARQQDGSDNQSEIDADYVHVMGGIGYQGYALRAGWERLSGSAADGQFRTPLATLHAFNGWADKFLATPTNGLADLYVQASGPAGPLNVVLVYHIFRPTTGEGTHGRELDFQVTHRLPWGQLVGFRGARYSADDFSTSATKIWAYTQWAF